MRLQAQIFAVVLCSCAVAACGSDGNGSTGGTGGTGGGGGSGGGGQTSTVNGVVVSQGDTETPVAGVTVSVFGTSLSTTTDADGLFSLSNVPDGDRFFVTAVDGAWGIVDYWVVPDETQGGAVLGVVPDSDIALVETALGRTISAADGAVDVTFYEGAEGGETASLSASSDPPFTFALSGAPVEQDTVIADNDGYGDLVFSSVDPADGPITATVSGASGVTECFVDESPGTTYPILAKAITIVYAYCMPAQ